MANNEAITIEEVALDIQRALTQAIKNEKMELRPELVNNLYPLMLAILESVNTRCLETEDLVSRLIAESETIIQPQEASQFDETFNLGEQLYNELKITKHTDSIKELAEKFYISLVKTRELMNDFAIEDTETDEDEDEDEDYEDGIDVDVESTEEKE